MKNSIIILCKNIKLDKSYRNVLSYNESAMVELCYANEIGHRNNYSFVGYDKNQIEVDFTYGECLQCNYIAFQNPSYSNKWFFAFVDKIEYRNNGSTRIHYTIDEFTTWFDYWSASPCLVLREHVTNDAVGLHTYPENLEHGKYIVNNYSEYGQFEVTHTYTVVATTWMPSNTPHLPDSNRHGGVISGCYYVVFQTSIDATNFIKAINGLSREEAIVAVFVIPDFMATFSTWYEGTITSKVNLMDGTVQDQTFTIHFNFLPNTQGSVNYPSDYTVSMNTSLNGYVPKNNKLLCHPYNYLLVTNGNGVNAEFLYEDFINNTPIFSITGVASPGCSIKCFPKNYKLISDTSTSHPGFNDGIMAGKFPIGSYQNDSFVNWMVDQNVNVSMSKVGAVATIANMFLNSSGDDGVGNPIGSYAGLFRQQANYLSQRYQHALVSPQAMGNTNGADVAFAFDEMNFGFYKMSITYEYAQKLDEYLSRFGYAINRVKMPNQTGRTYWNYVQIGATENIGYPSGTIQVPADSMDLINKIYRNGVTLWHSHSNLGNYSLNNTIVSS